jgi:hemerythrin-like domain-containing protein
MATTDNLISVITQDHREVEAVFQELESGAGTPEHRRDLADHVIAELVRHSVAEEQYMYPAAREALDGGDELVDHELEEHAEAEKLMKELDGLHPADPRFDELLGTLTSEIRHHIEDEESDLLPKLEAMAPTHPHPSAPDKPPANKILGPGAALVDRMRDALTGRET